MHTILALAAALSFTGHGSFTLTQARHVDVKYEHSIGVGSRVGACRWLDRHDAECAVRLTATVINGTAPNSYAWNDKITRSGACSNPGRVVSRHNGVTVQNMGHHEGNCFTGPLVAVPIASTLQDF